MINSVLNFRLCVGIRRLFFDDLALANVLSPKFFIQFIEELLPFTTLRFFASVKQPSNNLLIFESITVVLRLISHIFVQLTNLNTYFFNLVIEALLFRIHSAMSFFKSHCFFIQVSH